MTEHGEVSARDALAPPGLADGARPPTDAELLTACVGGDPVAWDALVSRYCDLVFSVGLREGLDDDGAAAVVEATFLALLDGAHGIGDADRLAFWLVSTARQEVERVDRARTREQGGGARAAGGSPVGAHRVKLAMRCEWDRVSTLHQALAQLPAHQRRTVEQDYLLHSRPGPHEAPAADVADRSRALDRLRLEMTEKDDA